MTIFIDERRSMEQLYLSLTRNLIKSEDRFSDAHWKVVKLKCNSTVVWTKEKVYKVYYLKSNRLCSDYIKSYGKEKFYFLLKQLIQNDGLYYYDIKFGYYKGLKGLVRREDVS
ncbi:MAG: hypothetical protein RR370_01735 [Synergistaceae bacterium]